MKYIRTEDEILSNSRPDIEDIDSVLTDQRGWIKKCNVVKVSDNLEELCDVFVYNKCVYMTLEEAINDKEWEESDDGIIYGAIWTPKGLIYVAEMNDNLREISN